MVQCMVTHQHDPQAPWSLTGVVYTPAQLTVPFTKNEVLGSPLIASSGLSCET